jgi:hypothetical protein
VAGVFFPRRLHNQFVGACLVTWHCCVCSELVGYKSYLGEMSTVQLRR